MNDTNIFGNYYSNMIQVIFPVKSIVYYYSKKFCGIHFRDFLMVHIDFTIGCNYFTLISEQYKVGLNNI